jgi:hypothetical protein
VPLLPVPAKLSHLEKDALIAALTARLALAEESIQNPGGDYAATDRT